MELSHLRTFVAVARHGNITRAAESLSLTPSPVSRTIRELEREIGEPLFDRAYHSLTLTPRGEHLLAHAIEMLRLAHQAKRAPVAPLRLGATPWAPSRFAARMREAAASSWDGDVEFEEAMSSELLPRLRFGELDAALVHLPFAAPGIATHEVAVYEHMLAGYPMREQSEGGKPTVLVLPLQLQVDTMRLMVEYLKETGHTDIEEISFADLVTVQSRMRRTGARLLATRAKDTPIGALLQLDELEMQPLPAGEHPTKLGFAYRSMNAEQLPALLQIVEALAPTGQDLTVI